jgi:uncharacterized membrane protein (DUF485 family)
VSSTDQTGSGIDAETWADAQRSPEFALLRQRLRTFVFPVSGLFLAWYLIYVLLADYAHGFMSIKVAGNINIGLVLGLLQFVTTFVITTLYVRYANTKLDPLAEQICETVEGAGVRGDSPAGTPSVEEVATAADADDEAEGPDADAVESDSVEDVDTAEDTGKDGVVAEAEDADSDADAVESDSVEDVDTAEDTDKDGDANDGAEDTSDDTKAGSSAAQNTTATAETPEGDAR